MNEFSEEILNKNIEAIDVLQMQFAKELRKIDFESLTFETAYEKEAKDGSSYLVIAKDGVETAMNSKFRPVNEAEKYALQFEGIKDFAVSLILGFGNGTFAREMVKYGSDKVRWCFYEPSRESFLYTVSHVDITDIIKTKRVAIFVEGINVDEYAAYLPEMVDWTNIPLTEIYVLPKYADMFLESYKNFVTMTRDVVARAQMGMNTLVAYAHQQLENAVLHMHQIFYGTSGRSFVDKFPKDLPAIIVSAGPSLAKNVEYLKEAKGKAFILCVDTALRFILPKGIVPDAVIGVDPVKRAAYRADYPDIYKDIMWITETVSNANVTECINSYRNVFIDGEDEVNDYFYKNLSGISLPIMGSGGSVANSAFSVVESWGFETVILIGQDLALTGGRRYADSADNSAETEAKAKGFSIMEVPGYYGETVRTRDDYYTYLKWFSGSFFMTKVTNVINATEGGALIDNAVNMPLKDAIDKYAVKEYDIRAIIESVPRAFNDEQMDEIEKYIRLLPSRAKFFMREFKEGKNLAERALTLLERGNASPKEQTSIYKRLDEIEAETVNELEYIWIKKRASKIEQTIMREQVMSGKSKENEGVDVIKPIIELYGGLYEGAEDMLSCCNELVKRLDETGRK